MTTQWELNSDIFTLGIGTYVFHRNWGFKVFVSPFPKLAFLSLCCINVLRFLTWWHAREDDNGHGWHRTSFPPPPPVAIKSTKLPTVFWRSVLWGSWQQLKKKKTFASLPDVSKLSERFTNSQTWGWYSLAKSYKVIIFSHPHIERFRHKNQGTDLSYLQLVRKRDQWGNSASTIACEILYTNADRKLHSKAASMFFKIQIRIRFKSVSLFSDSAMWGSRASLALISSSVKWDHDPPL